MRKGEVPVKEIVVETTAGKVKGTSHDGVHRFLGVPYGGDTGGANRFKPAPPLIPWSGVRDATVFGPSSWQSPGPGAEILKTFGGISEPSMGEDCLVLNVWTPSTDAATRPVLVWFHGGGHTTGSGSWPAYDGASLAGQGDAVVVTVNHRLGLLGYLYLAEMGGDEYATSGANGILDLAAVLAWVRDNIGSFGGDPSRVLAYGESGGGAKTSTLLVTPAAGGLFQRASIMSGASLRCQPADEATALAERTLSFLDIDVKGLHELHDVPVARLLQAQEAIGMGFQPVLDGVHITDHPLDAIGNGAALDVPLMIGTTRDEFRTFLLASGLSEGVPDDASLSEQLRPALGDDADRVVAGYRSGRPDSTTSDINVAILTDQHMRIPSIRMAEAASGTASSPVFMYRFDWETPAYEGQLGAGHGVDYPFFFDNLDSAVVSNDGIGREPLAAQMSGAVLALAAKGDPNHDGLPPWPSFNREHRSTMLFDVRSHVVNDPNGEERSIWENII
jgi:para-nitrobenzyl esterase